MIGAQLDCFYCLTETPPAPEASMAAEMARRQANLRRAEGLTIVGGTLVCRYHATATAAR